VLCREKGKSGWSRLPTNAAKSEFVSIKNGKRVVAVHRVCVCLLGTNRAGFQKSPVTLRDNTNEGVTLSILVLGWVLTPTADQAKPLYWPIAVTINIILT
jgi:hypothetical protein